MRRITSAVHGLVPPLLIAGRDALTAEARAELLLLADEWDAALAVAPDATGAIPSDHPRMLGVTGVMGHPAVPEYARQARVWVLAGTRLPQVASFGLTEAIAEATVVSINRGYCFPALDGHGDVHELTGSVADVLASLRRSVRRVGARAQRSVRAPASVDADDDLPLAGRRVIDALARHLQPGDDVFIDAGNVGAFAIHHLPSDGVGLRSVALGMGAMGHAFGAAIGACEHSGARTYVVAGDGAFYAGGMEIHTAIERRLPITFLILNNNAHAMCWLREERLLGGATTTNVFRPAQIATGLGALFPSLPAAEATDVGGLARALAAAGSRPGPSVISVTIPAEEQPPFWPLLPVTTEQELIA